MNHSVTLLTSLIPSGEINLFREFIYELNQLESKHLLRNEIILRFEDFSRKKRIPENDGSPVLGRFLSKTQEMILMEDFIVLQFRERVARYKFFRIHETNDPVEELTDEEFLDYREIIANKSREAPEKKLLIDFKPFYTHGPVIRDHRKIGSGQRFLNNYMAGKLQNEPEKWRSHLCEFLKIHSIHDEQILVDGEIIKNDEQLFHAIQEALGHLEALPENAPVQDANSLLTRLGLRDGFGDTVGHTLNTLQLLSNLLEEPNSDYLEDFISRIPMVSRVAIISPHGWFGQENVLGRPDTGGQIVYILDQVKALEKYLKQALARAGVSIQPQIIVLTRLIPENDGTKSSQRLEAIHGAENCWILRVPFRDHRQNVIPHWISRFHIWPYLEDFALEAKKELLTEFAGKPDLIVGNYSDGNLVASLLSSWLGVIQCNIAHALEKSKYIFSALYWEDMEKNYNFSMQFTADLLSMNRADIIIASTHQEIAGTTTSLGQYESYCLYSLPNLHKVVNGIGLYHPKFNVVSPGVDETIYFPYFQTETRLKNRTEELTQRLFTQSSEDIFGHLEDPDKRPVFSMARLDKIKNLTGLVEAFGLNPDLQEKANLVLVAGSIREERIKDDEEKHELKKMYRLVEKYNLHGKFRWLEKAARVDGAEMYRIAAERKGVFVQPALFEAFGLTVLEAMASGLPVFATQFGGPLEIILNGKSGFLINPTQPNLISQPLLEFFNRCELDPSHWDSISHQGIARVREAFTWELYSEKLIKFAKLYGFWNYSDLSVEKKEINQYCDLLFHLIFKLRAADLENASNGNHPPSS